MHPYHLMFGLKTLLKKKSGPLTSELLLRPNDFGLGRLPKNLETTATASSICGFCSTGCQLKIHFKGGKAIGLTPSPNYPVNLGMACPKGWEALSVLDSPDRATSPLLRGEDISWQEAAESFATEFKKIQEKHGKESVAFISTGQIATEEMAFLGSFAKFGMGVKHGDGNTRQCMATSVVAYKQAFGFDAPPYTYADLEESDVVLLIGSNLAIAHPILYQRLARNKRNPEIIAIDPRATETTQIATDHFAIKPKGDLYLLYALAHCLIRDDSVNHDFLEKHTEGFEEFSKFVTDYSPDVTREKTGIARRRVEALAKLITDPSKRVSMWWTMGVNQSHEGVRTAQAIINLCLMTGNIGKPGTGPNSITGQCNAMGSRLFSNTTNLLGGHDFGNPDHRAKISKILEVPEDSIPTEASWTYDQIINGIESGHIKGLWIIATNPAHSWINQSHFTKLRENLEFLVVQDMYANTETARIADLVLPAASWGEKNGTFINSERRIGTLKQVKKAPGKALSDFRIFQLLAQTWGVGDLFEKWTDPESVFGLLQKLSTDQACDITGINGYQDLDKSGGIQWPKTSESCQQERRLFEDGKFYTPSGKAKFLFEPPTPLPEPTSKEYPFTLLTGRGTSAQWHTQSRTQNSSVLRKLYPSALLLDINPDDAAVRGIQNHVALTISSRRASITAFAHVTNSIKPGEVYLPMHEPQVNRLTFPSFDPYSRQPSYKACAVQIRKLVGKATSLESLSP
ncbi:nitrate reductase [Akkermansiaceae bacterium]|nr:nitrate reductase [Akkermansiaceae bacterium]MDB4373206.1 nitrate reductase [bacterium]MDB4478227.1 nitrate reductase [Akkermansiaceae bacterium]